MNENGNNSAISISSMSKKMIIFILVIDFFVATIRSQERTNVYFSHYTTEQGLAHSSGNCFAQDSEGFLWIGSNGGLEKFDGYKFTIYKPEVGEPNSISSILVWSLFVDESDNLWIGTVGGGLNKYIRNKDEFISYRVDPANPKSISNNNISCIFKDLSGRLWIGTMGGGLNLFNKATGEFIHFKKNPSDPNSLKDNIIHTYCIDKSGMIWLGTENGISIFNPETNFCRNYIKRPGDLDKFDKAAIMSLASSHSGTIWIGTWRKGLYKYNEQQNQFVKLYDKSSQLGDEFYKVFEDTYRDIWIGTDKGLHKYIPKTNFFIHFATDPTDAKSLSDNFVRTIFEDKTEVLWIGTNNGGLNKYDLHLKKFNHFTYKADKPSSLSNTHVFSIIQDKSEKIWIGTRDGLNLFDQKRESFKCFKNNPDNLNSISNNSVYAIASGKLSEIWIGTNRGLNKLNTKTFNFTRYSNEPGNPNSLSNDNVRALYYDKSGNLWIGNWGGGLDKFEPDKDKFTNYPVDAANLTINVVLTIIEDKNGIFWLGTYGNGLVKFNPANNKMVYYKADRNNPKKLKDDIVNTVFIDHLGKTWVGTAGGGLSEFNPQTESFITYDVKDGLPSMEIYSILEDGKGNLWISTGKGLSKYDPNNKTFTNYDADDGLYARVFYNNSCCKSNTGEMYFGGVNGFDIFIPDSIQSNPYLPQIAICDFQVFNRSVRIGEKINGRIILQHPVSETKEIVLSHKEYIFSIEFTSLHFASPMKNKYAYMLEGFDKGWVNTDATRRFVSYTTLEPGKYTFRVKGSNNDGLWNETGTSIKITILPPWWNTLWFKLAFVIFILFSLVTFFMYRISRLKKQQIILAQKVKERTIELEQAYQSLKKTEDELIKLNITKDKFFSILAHDIRSPLGGIISITELMKSYSNEIIDDEKMEMIETINKSSQQLYNLLENLLNWSRLQTGKIPYMPNDFKLFEMSEAIIELHKANAEKKNIEVVNLIDPNCIVKADKGMINLVLRNLVSNAIKFTNENGKITIKSEFRDNSINISVEDNGVGITKENIAKLFRIDEHITSIGTNKELGTGLGLILCKEFIEKHNGKIWVESELEHGSKFIFSLPLDIH